MARRTDRQTKAARNTVLYDKATLSAAGLIFGAKTPGTHTRSCVQPQVSALCAFPCVSIFFSFLSFFFFKTEFLILERIPVELGTFSPFFFFFLLLKSFCF